MTKPHAPRRRPKVRAPRPPFAPRTYQTITGWCWKTNRGDLTHRVWIYGGKPKEAPCKVPKGRWVRVAILEIP